MPSHSLSAGRLRRAVSRLIALAALHVTVAAACGAPAWAQDSSTTPKAVPPAAPAADTSRVAKVVADSQRQQLAKDSLEAAARVVAPATAGPDSSRSVKVAPDSPRQSVAKDSVGATAALSALPTAALPAAPAPGAIASLTGTGGSRADSASELANPFVQRAISLYEQGQNEAAIAEYRKGITSDPLDSDNWFGLAELQYELGRTKQAIETYTIALKTIEHAPELRLPFAELLMTNRLKSEAIQVLQDGIVIDPEDAELKGMLGKLLLGVLDDTMMAPADSAAAASTNGSTEKAGTTAGGTTSAVGSTPAKPKPKIDRKKRKKLCKLFCPGTFDPIAPKPE